MQHFDGEIERLVRKGVVDFETGIHFATNPGNLRLEMADLMEIAAASRAGFSSSEVELEIER